MMRLLKITIYVLLIFGFTEASYGTVINFDDLGEGLVPPGYAGVIWGTSILSRPHADSTSFYAISKQTYGTPRSGLGYVINGHGVPDLWFEFSAPVNFKGAWFASPKDNRFAAQKVRLVDDLGQTSAWLELTHSPQYLEANFTNSKRIYVQPRGIYDVAENNVVETNGGWYVLDDITYEPIPASIQHSLTIDISGTGSGSVNSNPSGVVACSYSPLAGVCASVQPLNTSLTLIATPGKGSRFAFWSGSCGSCVGLSCGVTLESDETCSARFELLPLVRSEGPTFHPTITTAYIQRPEGVPSTIQVQAGQLSDTLQFSRDVPLTVMGGYNIDFSTRSGEHTVVLGTLTISRGSLKVDKVSIR